jgi:hypothetical protein
MKSLVAAFPVTGWKVKIQVRAVLVFKVNDEAPATRRKPRSINCAKARPAADLERRIRAASRTEYEISPLFSPSNLSVTSRKRDFASDRSDSHAGDFSR